MKMSEKHICEFDWPICSDDGYGHSEVHMYCKICNRCIIDGEISSLINSAIKKEK